MTFSLKSCQTLRLLVACLALLILVDLDWLPLAASSDAWASGGWNYSWADNCDWDCGDDDDDDDDGDCNDEAPVPEPTTLLLLGLGLGGVVVVKRKQLFRRNS